MEKWSGAQDSRQVYQWYESFAPARVLLHNVRTGEQIQEPSLVAVKLSTSQRRTLAYSGEVFYPHPAAIERCLAVGREALDYRDAPNTAVYSPLRQGQIADYDGALCLFRELYRRVRSKISLKPVLCVYRQEHTTDVEERALIEAGIQMGARQVLLYREHFPVLLDRARADPKLKNGYILHMEPQDERGM